MTAQTRTRVSLCSHRAYGKALVTELTRVTGFAQILGAQKTTPHQMPPVGTLPNPHFHTATAMLSASCNLYGHSFQIKKPWRRS